MNLSSPVLEVQWLQDAAAALSVTLDTEQAGKLLSYIGQLQRWNRSYNLTAIKDPVQMLLHHVVDSLAVIPVLRQRLYKNTAICEGERLRVVDVGSGAGLPGIVIAVLEPQCEVVCVDAVEKKTTFIRQMAGVLTLPNLTAVHARVETLVAQQAAVVVSRAFASLDDFARLSGVHVAPGGCLLAMKGKIPEDEIAALPETGWVVTEITELQVPGLSANRCLITLNREGST